MILISFLFQKEDVKNWINSIEVSKKMEELDSVNEWTNFLKKEWGKLEWIKKSKRDLQALFLINNFDWQFTRNQIKEIFSKFDGYDIISNNILQNLITEDWNWISELRMDENWENKRTGRFNWKDWKIDIWPLLKVGSDWKISLTDKWNQILQNKLNGA